MLRDLVDLLAQRQAPLVGTTSTASAWVFSDLLADVRPIAHSDDQRSVVFDIKQPAGLVMAEFFDHGVARLTIWDTSRSGPLRTSPPVALNQEAAPMQAAVELRAKQGVDTEVALLEVWGCFGGSREAWRWNHGFLFGGSWRRDVSLDHRLLEAMIRQPQPSYDP